jgi:hypothetical protein
MVSGGMAAMGDEEIETIIKTGEEVLADRDPNRLSTDASYLQQYTAICESYVMSNISHRDALVKLRDLNTEFEGRISAAAKKTNVPAPSGARFYGDLDDEEEDDDDEWGYGRGGWMPSSIC